MGHAILFEATRPHKIAPSTEADGLEARMVLHAFLVPCTATNGEVEYQMIGPLGGSRAESRTST